LGWVSCEIFEDDGGFEDHGVAHLEQRHLAERRDGAKPAGLVGEIDIGRSNGTAFSVSAITARCT
jgi:hypothetical protein